jgi:hypothetical protein
MADRVPVKMLGYYNGINAGEIAGFVPEVAERLIEQGLAEPYDDGSEETDDGAPDEPKTAPKPAVTVASGKPKGELPVQGAGG